VHGHYTRAEIETAYCFAEGFGYGVLSTESPWIHREGVLWNDLALGPGLFHWESQSTTTASSPTGQRYIHHASRGSRVLLYRYAEACGYVHEQRKQDGRPGAPTEPFVCLGFAIYESHEGERPMTIRWRLEHEIPAAWLHGCCVAHRLLLGIAAALAV
jgi:hypothetical protein